MVEWYAALSLVGQNNQPMKLTGDLRPVLQVPSQAMDEGLERLAKRPDLPTLARNS